MTATKSPFDKDHRIGRLGVVAAVHDLDDAMAYRPRLESLAWEKFPQVLTRIFDDFAPADAIFQLDELDLDLGTIRPAFLETDAIAALEQALVEALTSAIHDAKLGQLDDRHLVDTPTWRLQRMEAFLRNGIPGFSMELSSFDPASEAIWLMNNEPETFIAMIGRQSDHRHALDRLFLQMSEAGRERLVKLLAPSQAADTIGLIKDMDDLLSGFRSSSPRITGSMLRQKFWVKTIAYLVQASGSSYDPKVLLRKTLSNVAEQMRISLPELILSIADTHFAGGHRSYRHPGLGNVLAAMKAEQESQKSEVSRREIIDVMTSDIAEWRKLLDRPESSGSSKYVIFSDLTKAQFEALLIAWAPEGFILERRKVLVQSYAQTARGDARIEDAINEAIFQHISDHIDKTADFTLLWKQVLAAIKPINNDEALALEIVDILLSTSVHPEKQIAALIDSAVAQDADKSEPRSGNIDRAQEVGRGRPASSATQNDKPWKPGDSGVSRSVSSLKSDIAIAMESSSDEWMRLLQKHAQTAGARTVLLNILSSHEFDSLVVTITGDQASPTMRRALISAISKVRSVDATVPIKAALLEYLAMQGDRPIDSISLWQHLLAAVVPATKYDKIRSNIVEILSSGTTLTEQELAKFLADDDNRKSDSSSSQFRKPAPETGDSAQDTARPKASRTSKKTTVDHSDVVRKILENPTEWRDLLRIYAQNANDRVLLLAAMNAAQFGSLLLAATGDPTVVATQRALRSALSKVIDVDADARSDAVILEYLASHDSNPIDIRTLWKHSLETLFSVGISVEEKCATSRTIFDLLPYDDDRVGSELCQVLLEFAGKKVAMKPGSNQSDSRPLTKVKNADFIVSVLEYDEQALLGKLRAVIPRLPSSSPLPVIRFDEGDFETIARRLRPADIAPIFAGIEAILDLQKSRPFIPVHQDRLAELVRYKVIANLIWQSQKRMHPVSFWEILMDQLAKSYNMPVPSLASRLQSGFMQIGGEQTDISALQKAIAALVAQPKPAESKSEIVGDRDIAVAIDDGNPPDKIISEDDSLISQGKHPVLSDEASPDTNITLSDREAMSAYLSNGSFQKQSEILVLAAEHDPAWLAELARQSVSSATDATIVAERLLFWLKPRDILNFLAPALTSSLMQRAPKSSDVEDWWTEVIAALLVGKVPATTAAQQVPADAEAKTGDGRRAVEVGADGDSADNMPYEQVSISAQDGDFDPSLKRASADRITLAEREAVAAYLKLGDRQEQLEILVRAAKQDPAWLAELARTSVSATSDATVVAERLLFWLMPSEILEFLAPALAGALLQRAPKSDNDEDWWKQAIATLLLGDVPSTADDIEEGNSPVQHFDRLASLQHWLDGGNVTRNAAEQFLRLTQAERISLLRADTVDATLHKIQIAASTLGMEKTEALLQEIIGWALLKKGPLAVLISEHGADQHIMLLRAAAASLVSTEIDLTKLADPLPAFTRASQLDDMEDPGESENRKSGASDLIAWLEGKPVKAEEMSRLRKRFDFLIENQDSQLLNFISSHFHREEQRSRWVRLLPKASLGRLLYLKAPNAARILHDGVTLLTTAGSQLLPFDSPASDSKKLWLSVFDALAGPRQIEITAIFSRLVLDAAGDDAELERKIRARALSLVGPDQHRTIATALRRTPLSDAEHDVAQSSDKLPNDLSWDSFDNETRPDAGTEPDDQPIYIANAGLILINPFLPVFFERLELFSLDENGKPHIDSEPAASRAVHLLEYLVTGQTASPEPLLVLNKILCGLPTGTPVASAIEPDLKDIEICDGLLEGIMENWPALQGSSVDALRETFFQREGRLEYSDQKWTLQIQRKTVDILKDQVPWNTSVIYHPWMSEPIHTTW